MEGNPLRPHRLYRAALSTSMLWAAGTLLVGLAAFWSQAAGGGFPQLDLLLVCLAIGFAALSFFQRLLRWFLLAACLAPSLDFRSAAAFGSIGFALTLTPGRAGEVMKLWLLQRHSSVPIAASAPILLVEKLTEGLGFLAVLVLGAAFVAESLLLSEGGPWGALLGPGNVSAWVTLGIALVVAGGVAVRRPAGRLLARNSPVVVARLARLPYVRDLVRGGSRVLAPRPLLEALAVSVTARLCDAAALYWTARAFSLELSVGEAMLVLGSAGVVGGLSLLPAGIGAVEATMVAALTALGHDVTLALSAVLLTRVFILWQWVALGLGLAIRHMGDEVRGPVGARAGRRWSGKASFRGVEAPATVRPLAHSPTHSAPRRGGKA